MAITPHISLLFLKTVGLLPLYLQHGLGSCEFVLAKKKDFLELDEQYHQLALSVPLSDSTSVEVQTPLFLICYAEQAV